VLNARDVEQHFEPEGGDNSHNSLNSQAIRNNKPVLADQALYGLAGDIVKAIDPYTESDPVGVLTNLLVAFGNVIGNTPHFRVEYTKHPLNLFVVHVGDSAKGRKGTSWSTPKRIFKEIDPVWIEQRVTGGLSSGEGVIYAVRDQRMEKQQIKPRGKVTGYQNVIVDHGVRDKRLLLVEEEFSQALKVMSREGNILSQIIRQAWDGDTLSPLIKNNPIRATNAHISIIGHITKDELLRHLTETEQSNGFANRFCWFLVARSKSISNPTGTPDAILTPLIDRLRDAVSFAHAVQAIQRDSGAETLWDGIYPELSDGMPGLLGATISRAEAQVMRLACIYALLDMSNLIRVEHLHAALALWDYSEKSALAIFGDLTGDPAVDKVKEALKAKGKLTMTDLHGLFGRHATAEEVDRVVRVLVADRVATTETVKDGSRRPTTILICAAKKAN